MAYAGPSSATGITLALDSAYTYASAGDAVFWQFVAQESADLTDFWVKVSSYTGTWASTDGVINVEIRAGLNGNSIPGTTATGTFTITLDGSTTGWIKKSGLSIALTAGTVYSCVIADADGGASNYVTIVNRAILQPFTSNAGLATSLNVTTTTTANGYSSAGTAGASPAVSFAKVGSLYYGGTAFSSVAGSTSNQMEKGMRFAPYDDCVFAGWVFSTANQTFWAASRDFKLYATGASPGDPTLVTFTGVDIASGTSPLPSVLMLPVASRVDLTAGTFYRCAVDPTTNSAAPSKCTIGGSPDADILAACMPFGNAHYIEEAAGPTWDDTQTAVLPTFGPLLLPKTASAASNVTFFIPME
jgi:hypothetical protein